MQAAVVGYKLSPFDRFQCGVGVKKNFDRRATQALNLLRDAIDDFSERMSFAAADNAFAAWRECLLRRGSANRAHCVVDIDEVAHAVLVAIEIKWSTFECAAHNGVQDNARFKVGVVGWQWTVDIRESQRHSWQTERLGVIAEITFGGQFIDCIKREWLIRRVFVNESCSWAANDVCRTRQNDSWLKV